MTLFSQVIVGLQKTLDAFMKCHEAVDQIGAESTIGVVVSELAPTFITTQIRSQRGCAITTKMERISYRASI